MKEVTRILEDNEVSMNIESWGDRGKKNTNIIFWSFTI